MKVDYQLWAAVAISLAIHALIVGILFSLALNNSGSEINDTQGGVMGVEVVFTARNRFRTVNESNAEAPEEESEGERRRPESNASTSEQKEIVVVHDSQPALSEETYVSLHVSEETENSSEEGREQELSAQDITAAVSSFLENNRSSLGELWLEECVHYRNRHGQRDCDEAFQGVYSSNDNVHESVGQLFTDILPDDYNTRHIRNFQSENAQLSLIIKEGGLPGDIAKEIVDLNEQKINYLNREFSNGVVANICIPMPCIFRFKESEVSRTESEQSTPFTLAAPSLFRN